MGIHNTGGSGKNAGVHVDAGRGRGLAWKRNSCCVDIKFLPVPAPNVVLARLPRVPRCQLAPLLGRQRWQHFRCAVGTQGTRDRSATIDTNTIASEVKLLATMCSGQCSANSNRSSTSDVILSQN
jgi:hypothetical protein